ncbi:MAG: hypothetical protein GX066_01015 [Clostridiaceae bacterium]|nr:hypothetical protein [Clostridiaceae bacterium]
MLDLGKLKTHNSDILKAEIGALLFNMGKTHVGFGNFKEYFIKYFPYDEVNIKFSSYKHYYDKGYFCDELCEVSKELKDFFCGLSVDLPSYDLKDKKLKDKKIKLIEFMKAGESSEDLSSEIFFRGCENINSCLDKGELVKRDKTSGIPRLFVANAFGTFKKEFSIKDMDERRRRFWIEFHKFMDGNGYYKNPDWKVIRKWLFENIKPWYSSILSDDRFPANDATLWDQVQMVASMFKAVLANMCLIVSDTAGQGRIKTYFESPASIKWRIMGIQYDKLSLAERGLRPSQIKLYRETAKIIDEKIKYLVETCYSLGNEIYRDETGIYFIVGEDLGKDDNISLTELHPDLMEVKNRIVDIFGKLKELYPAIFLTKPFRGLMNLTFILEEARNNFLHDKVKRKIYYKNKIINRLDKWMDNTGDETIRTPGLQDKNGRIALVTMKFELKEWLNGNMLNSLLIRRVDYCKRLEEIKMFFRTFFSKETVFMEDDSWLNEIKKESIRILPTIPQYDKSSFAKNVKGRSGDIKKEANEIELLVKNLRNELFNNSIKLDEKIKTVKYYDNNFEEVIGLFYEDLNSLYENAISLKENFLKYKDYFKEETYNKFMNSINKFIDRLRELQKGGFFIGDLAKNSYKGCKANNETLDDWIRQVFFDSITGNEWEDFIKNTSLGKFIDWDTRTILWDKWSKEEIEFFSILLLQFIIRKNPSPARLRRIWETTEDFFRQIENNICQNYKPCFSIIEPTPVSWEFAIPAGYVPSLIKNINRLYSRHFKFVYGKLPLHTGVIIQDYKKPLYIGIRALRKIRCDDVKREDLKKEIKANKLKLLLYNCKSESADVEDFYETGKYYLIYEMSNKTTDAAEHYNFYLYPDNHGLKQLKPLDCAGDDESIIYFPNTFDFELIDTNNRIDEILYRRGKRVLPLKNNRPYTMEEAEKIIKLWDIFNDISVSQFHKFIIMLSRKYEDWNIENDDTNIVNFKFFFVSLLLNLSKITGKVKNDKFQKNICEMLEISNINELTEKSNDEIRWIAKLFFDVFEFWCKALKE